VVRGFALVAAAAVVISSRDPTVEIGEDRSQAPSGLVLFGLVGNAVVNSKSIPPSKLRSQHKLEVNARGQCLASLCIYPPRMLLADTSDTITTTTTLHPSVLNPHTRCIEQTTDIPI